MNSLEIDGKIKKALFLCFLVLLFFIFTEVSFAATHTCGTNGVNNSCTPALMTSLIASASDGDTINIATGTHAWSSCVTVNKRITINGGGTYAVDGNHNDIGTWPAKLLTSGNGAFLINVTGSGSGTVSIKGIFFEGTLPVSTYNSAGGSTDSFVCEWYNNKADFVIKDNKFHCTGPNNYMVIVVRTTSFSTGVINSCYFTSDSVNGKHIYTIRVTQDEVYADPQYSGVTSFGRDIVWGSGTNWLFVENCTFIRPTGTVTGSDFGMSYDSHLGGRIAFRYNYCKNDWIESHILSGGAWTKGGGVAEIYGNTFTWAQSASWQAGYYHRSGALLFHNNVITGNYQDVVKLTTNGRGPSVNPGNYGSVDGSKDWDGNCQAGSSNPNAEEPTDCGSPGAPYPSGYPAMDQPGRGKAAGSYTRNNAPVVQSQKLLPVRFWSNTFSGQVGGGNCSANPHGRFLCLSGDTGYFVIGRDYYYSTDNSAAEPGYTSYTYPHPLASDGEPSLDILSVTKAGTGLGTITSSPSGINCGSDCSGTYGSGTSVTLTATPDTNSTFAGWSGACTGTGMTCTVTIAAAKTATATFTLSTGKPAYYVKTTGCSDANNGSESAPWCHCPGMTGWSGSATLSAGDAVYFDRGGTWSASSGSNFLNVKGGVTYIGDTWGTGTRARLQCSGHTGNMVHFYQDHATYETVVKGFDLDANNRNVAGVSFNRDPGPYGLMTGATKRVQNCLIHGSLGTGYVAYGIIISHFLSPNPENYVTENVEILDNKVYDQGRTAINLYTSNAIDGCRIGKILVRGNETYNTARNSDYDAGYGMVVKNHVDDVIIEHNYFHGANGSSGGAAYIDSDINNGSGPSNITYRYNIFNNTTNANLQIRNYGNKLFYIYGNLFIGNGGGQGILLANNSNTINGYFYNNTLYNDAVNIQAGTATGNLVFKNNVIYSPSGVIPFVDTSTPHTTNHSNNLYYRSGGGTLVSSGGSSYTALNLASYESSGLSSNPLFVNTSNLPTGFTGIYGIDIQPNTDGLSLQSNSPAINTGTNLGISYVNSINSIVRSSSDSAWDIGAYEYVSGTPPSTYTLNVVKSGTGSGTVAGMGINCGFDCTETVSSGASITLTASPDSGSVFSGWSGGCLGTGTCTLTMNSSTTVTAGFNQSGLPVNLLTNGDFESGFTSGLANGWQITTDGAVAYSVFQDTGYQGSSQKISITTPGSWGLFFYQTPVFQLNQSYTWSFWYKTQGGDLWAQITNGPNTQVVFQRQLSDTNGTWQQATLNFQYTNTQADQLRFYSNTQGTYWFDNIQLVTGANDSTPPVAPTGLTVN